MLNREKFIFLACTAMLAFMTFWMLKSTPIPHGDVKAYSPGDVQTLSEASARTTWNLNDVIGKGINPFALPPEVTHVIDQPTFGPDNPDNPDNPDGPDTPDKPTKPHGDKPPLPPPPDKPDKPDPNASTPADNPMLPPPKYKWPVTFGGITQIGNKRYVHIKTDDGREVMASEGDTLELINSDGEPEDVTIVEITIDRIRVRNHGGQETDLSYDRLKFKGTVFPETKDDDYDVSNEDAAREYRKK